jgi:hypothetical protein
MSGRTRTTSRSATLWIFWRVLIADKTSRRLLLFAKMRLPGEAWLEFKIVPAKDGEQLVQTATIRPTRSSRPALLVCSAAAARLHFQWHDQPDREVIAE